MSLFASDRQSHEDLPDVNKMTVEEIEAELFKRKCTFPLDWGDYTLEDRKDFLLRWRRDDDA